MIRLQSGRDYQLYRIYIWGGLAAIIIYTLVLALTLAAADGKKMLILTGIPLSLWITGILAYWWWVFLFKDKMDLAEPFDNSGLSTPSLKKLSSWSSLHTAMAFDSSQIKKTGRSRVFGPVLIWYGMQNLLVFWVLGNFWLYILYFEETVGQNYVKKIWAPGVMVIIGLFFLITPFLLFRAKKSSFAYLAELGLGLEDSRSRDTFNSGINAAAEIIPKGAVFIKGVRFNRQVIIATKGRLSLTRISAGGVHDFEVHSREGKLIAGPDTPEQVKDFLKTLPKAKRWRGISLTGDDSGILIIRKSPGLNMWLYDLWLSERLLEILGSRGAGSGTDSKNFAD